MLVFRNSNSKEKKKHARLSQLPAHSRGLIGYLSHKGTKHELNLRTVSLITLETSTKTQKVRVHQILKQQRVPKVHETENMIVLPVHSADGVMEMDSVKHGATQDPMEVASNHDQGHE